MKVREVIRVLTDNGFREDRQVVVHRSGPGPDPAWPEPKDETLLKISRIGGLKQLTG